MYTTIYFTYMNLLGISIVGAAPFISTVKFTTLWVWTSNGIRVQDTSNHSRHHHDKNWQNFEETSQNGASFRMDVVLGTQGSLDNDLKFGKQIDGIETKDVTTMCRVWTLLRLNWDCAPTLKNLHWLPAEARINLKILLITYKILNGQSTSYLEPIIQEYHPSRTLRSSTCSLLCIPSIKSNSYGGRAFSAAAPELWNSIPEYTVCIKRAETVGIFKTRLKTFLFQKHYC